jgi:fucose 4-O-acetylase-like acetyltransferase
MIRQRQADTGGRDAWVDDAKAIGIVLVVYGHVARGVFNAGIPMDVPLYRLVDSIIYSFHMPLFFFLSGLFFHHSLCRRGPVALAANKVDTILYPYVLWSLIQGLTEVGLAGYTTGSASLAEVFALWNPRAQFWFLYALFLVVLTAILVYRRDTGVVVVAVLALSGLVYVFQASIPSALHSDYVVKNFVFFALGVVFIRIKDRLIPRLPLWTGLGLLAFIAGQYLFHGELELSFEDKGAGSLMLATVSILAVACLSMWIARFRIPWLSALGRASMAIYLMHILAGSGARILLSRIFGVQDAVVHIAVGTLASILLPILAVWIWSRLGISGMLEAPARLSAEAWYGRYRATRAA